GCGTGDAHAAGYKDDARRHQCTCDGAPPGGPKFSSQDNAFRLVQLCCRTCSAIVFRESELLVIRMVSRRRYRAYGSTRQYPDDYQSEAARRYPSIAGYTNTTTIPNDQANVLSRGSATGPPKERPFIASIATDIGCSATTGCSHFG
ncbi:MAG: hypothetical protein ACI9JD_004946, partial [Rhodococcus sp. (in: high G+C Gram-positive bacteria)]